MATTPSSTDHSSDTRRHALRFATGRLVAGRYEILEQIGEGGTAEVFRARDHRLDRLVAVKVLRPQYGQDPDARARFAVEARSAAALAVSNVVPVYDFGAADDGSLFIVMRFIDGPSLRRILSERGSLPSAEAIRVGRDVAQALAAAHAGGLIHRDVKPGNILIDGDGTAHLTDFGIVKALAGAVDLTRPGMTFGTAAYLSPEQATGAPVSPSTDLYALGVVLYEVLAGRTPFDGDDPLTVSYRHAHETPLALGVLVPGIDERLERMVMQCLEKSPERRPSSAQEVADRLAQVASGTGPIVTSDTPSTALIAAGGVAIARSEHGLTGSGSPFRADPRESEKETVRVTAIGPHAGPDPRVGQPPIPPSPLPLAPAWLPTPPVPIRSTGAGVAPAAQRARRRRRVSATGIAIVLLSAALVVLAGTALALPRLLDRDDGAGTADASASPRPRRTVAPSEPAIVVGEATMGVTPNPGATVGPAPSPSAAESPSTTPVPTPGRTRRPRPEPTGEPTPSSEPTSSPQPTQPPVATFRERIPDRSFEGDYDGQGSGTYHGRSASWVYGTGTPYDTMTARFRLEHDGRIVGRASLRVVGLDGDDPPKHRMAIVVNGVTVFEGPDPLPNDECCGPSGPGNWGAAVFRFSGDILRHNNSLVVRNLEPGDCTTCPNYVMIDYATLAFRSQP